MLEQLSPLLKNLPPRTARALRQAINRCGEELGVGSDWVQRWIGFTVVADALTGYTVGGEPAFELKGGAAIELRLRWPNKGSEGGIAARPRATRDLDAAFRGELDDIESAVEAALEEPRPPFGFRVEAGGKSPPFMRRFRIRILFLEEQFGRVVERSFSNVKLEVSIYEGEHPAPDLVPAFSLKPFGLEGPDVIPCIPLTKQVAQKLHAATEPPNEGRSNERFRDLVDIALLSALVPATSGLRAVCEDTFAIRGKQAWPPEITIFETWAEPLEEMAGEMGLPQRTAEEIARHVEEYVQQIAIAGSSDQQAAQ
jgi:hypothetical protein